jgi:hypothetical protein
VAQVATLAALGMAPDLDLLIGSHRGVSHSLGAAALAACAAAAAHAPVAETRLRIALAAFAAWASHPLLDAFGHDNAPPLGVMAFWPFSHEYVKTDWPIFGPISRRWWTWRFYVYNGFNVLREIVILGPLVALVARYRRRESPIRTSDWQR